MGEIKSAAEIAREKLEKIGEVTEEERLKWKYMPEGEKLAARFIQEKVDLAAELGKYEEKARPHVIAGINDILLRNINLPKNDIAKKNTQRALDGLKAVKKDKTAVEDVFGRIKHVIDHYTQNGAQQKRQAYESLKAEYEVKVQQALKQQLGVDTQMKIDVERQPQFQDDWQRLQSQMDAQYTKLLDEYKKELAGIV